MLKVILVVDSKIHFPFKKLLNQDRKCFLELRKSFTHVNSKYYKLRNMGHPTVGVPKTLKSFHQAKDEIFFNRGCLRKIKTILKKFSHVPRIRDHRLETPPISFDSNIVLRDEQKLPVSLMIKKQQGLIRGPCSSGKTCMLLQAVAKAKQPALIIVWNTTHQKQWIKEATDPKLFNLPMCDIGGIGGVFKKPKFGKLNICMQQSLWKKENLDLFVDRVGFVGADECLHPDTMIALRSGHKPLGEIEIGDEVRTPSGSFAFVKNKWVSRKRARKYITKNGTSLIGSINHPVAVRRTASKRFGSLHSYREIDELKNAENIEVYRSRDYTNSDFSIEEYFLGWFAADGCIDRHRGRNCVQFAFRRIEKVKIFRWLVTELGFDCRQSKNSRGDFIFRFGSDVFDYIKLVGMDDRTSKTVSVPNDLFRKLSVSFISGLFDGDATFGSNACIEFTTVSKDLVLQVKLMLNSLGIHQSLYEIKRANPKHNTSYRLAIFNYNVKRFQELIGFNVDSKKKNLKQYLSRIALKEKKYTSIVSSEPFGVCDLIDIELDNEEKLFIANGVVVHNCQRFSARTFQSSIGEFPAKYRLGVSANERRRDGMEPLIYDSFGKVLHEVQDVAVGSRMKAKIYLVPTLFRSDRYEWNANHIHLLDDMMVDQDRNEIIFRLIRRSVKKKKLVLVLVERKYQAMLLRFAFEKYGFKTGLLLGKTNVKYAEDNQWPEHWVDFISSFDSDKEFDRVNKLSEKKKLDVIIGTQKADVGLNIKTLDHVAVTTPSGHNIERFNQQKGRCERYLKGKKTPAIFYIWDVKMDRTREAGNSISRNFPGVSILRLKKKEGNKNG